MYVDTSFFVAFMNPEDSLHKDAQNLFKKYKGNIETSLLTVAELLVGCEKREIDPEIIVGSLFQICEVKGITMEQASRAAYYMKIKKLTTIDALHAALSNLEIISFDKDFDRTDVKRIWR